MPIEVKNIILKDETPFELDSELFLKIIMHIMVRLNLLIDLDCKM